MINYSALIIENELVNVDSIKMLLNKYFKQIETIYSSINLNEGIELFLEYRPNILFLTIDSVNEVTLFKSLESYDMRKSEIIFISASEEFALKAINHNASAYIIKPIEIEEFISSVSKVMDKIETRKNNLQVFNGERNPNLIAIASVNRIELIPIDEIISCSADGKYTIFSTKRNRVYTSSRNLGEYQDLLNPNIFFRIHHKHIININFVKSINKAEGYYCEMINGVNLPISKRKQDEFNRFIRLKF